MAQQIKKKFIGQDQIDGSKIKLLQGQSIRGTNSLGQEVDLVKISSQDKIEVLGQEVALKSALDQESSDRQSGDAATLASAQSYADQKVADLVNSAPEVLDTLKELADALGGDANFATTIAGQIGAVDDKVDAEIARAQAAEGELDGRLDILEPKVSTLESEMNQAQADISDLEGVVQGNFDLQQSDIDGLRSDVDALTVSLASEVSDRQAADAAEVLARDAAISVAVMAEQQARELFDGMLNSKIDQEILDRQAADQQLSENISSMATSLMGTIGAVNDRAIAAEEDLQSQIDALNGNFATDAELASAVSNLESLISAEQSRATQAEQDLDSRLDVLEPKVSTLESEMDSVEQSVLAEQSARTAADAALQAQIDALDGNFVTESELASAVSDIESQIDDLDGYAQEIRSDLDNLDGYAQEIRSDLDQEIADRQSADAATLSSAQDYTDGEIDALGQALDANINAEVANRIAGDEALDARIDVLEAKGFSKGVVTVGAELAFVDLDRQYSVLLSVSVGRLMVHEGEDFTVSVVDGKTRLTWIGSLLSPSGEEAIESGDKVFFSGAF